MKTLLLLALVAVLAACETTPDAIAPEPATIVTTDDLRGTWVFQAADPAASFRPTEDSFALGWAREVYAGHARVTMQAGGTMKWHFTDFPELFSERRADTTVVFGAYQLRYQGRETWLDLTDCDAEHLRLRIQNNTLLATDPKHHLLLTLTRE